MTEGTVTAARPVATKAIAKSGAGRTSVISKVTKDDSIIETVSGPIADAIWSRKKA